MGSIGYDLYIGKSKGTFGEPIRLKDVIYTFTVPGCERLYAMVKGIITYNGNPYETLPSQEISFNSGLNVPEHVDSKFNNNILTFTWQPIEKVITYRGYITIYTDKLIPDIPLRQRIIISHLI